MTSNADAKCYTKFDWLGEKRYCDDYKPNMNGTSFAGNISQHFLTYCETLGEKLPDIPRLTSSKYTANNGLGIIVNVILFFLIVGLNFITILTIWRSQKLKRTVCFFLIMLQSCADVIVGLVAIPMTIYLILTEILPVPSNCTLVTMHAKVLHLLIGNSLMMYLTITYKRYDVIFLGTSGTSYTFESLTTTTILYT